MEYRQISLKFSYQLFEQHRISNYPKRLTYFEWTIKEKRGGDPFGILRVRSNWLVHWIDVTRDYNFPVWRVFSGTPHTPLLVAAPR